MVIVMNEHIDGNAGNEGGASGGAPLPGRPLYKPGAHWLARMSFGSMLFFYLVGLVAVASTFTPHPLGWRDAAGFFMMIVFPLLVGTNLRTWAIYGSVQGLEIVRWGRRRTVPWSQVGAAGYAWWSLNYAARVARLTVHEEKDRTILFFANDRVLAEIERMRALYASG